MIDIEGLGAEIKIERTQLSKVRSQAAFSSPQLESSVERILLSSSPKSHLNIAWMWIMYDLLSITRLCQANKRWNNLTNDYRLGQSTFGNCRQLVFYEVWQFFIASISVFSYSINWIHSLWLKIQNVCCFNITSMNICRKTASWYKTTETKRIAC